MAFDDEDLRGELEVMFGALQVARDEETRSDKVFENVAREGGRSDILGAGRRATTGFNRGFRVFTPNPEKSEQRKADLRRYERGRAATEIRERLLAGERVALGNRGRPPSRWAKIASALGIELPKTAPAWERDLQRRILAGERPKPSRRKPTRWLKAAAAVGIDLYAPRETETR